MLGSALLSGGMVAGRATRDALFLSHFPASSLPTVIVGSSLIALLGAGFFAAWLSRSGPTRVVPISLVAYAGVFLGAWAALEPAPRPAAAVLYLQVTALGPLVVSGFWSAVSERFDPYTAKQNVSRLSGAGALAGVVAGVAAERVVSLAGAGWALGLLAALALLAAGSVRGVGASPEASPPAPAPGPEGSRLGPLVRHPLLGPMTAVMFLGAAVDSFLEYAFKAEAAAAWPDTVELLRFFSVFYVVTSLLAFLVQVFLGRRVLARFGVVAGVALLPALVVGFGAFAVASGRLAAVVAVRGIEAIGSGGLFRSSFEVLYTPLAPALKRSVRAWIDVSARRLGAMAGAGLTLFLIFVNPALGSATVVALGAAAALGMLLLMPRIHAAYVSELGSSLRAGGIEISSDDVEDATTAMTIAASRSVVDRRSLLEQARAYEPAKPSRTAVRPKDGAHPVGVPAAAQPAGATAASRPREADSAVEWIAEVTSGDAARVRRALHSRDVTQGRGFDRRVTAHVIPLICDPEVGRDAVAFLGRCGGRVVGQLVDALLDRTEDTAVRVALTPVLGGIIDRRAVEGLWRALDDPDRQLRRACARAALRIVERRRDFAPPADVVHARVAIELDDADAGWGRGELLDHVFSLLALPHGRDTMNSARTGVRSDHAGMRGTALELLESLLPPELSRAVIALIDREKGA